VKKFNSGKTLEDLISKISSQSQAFSQPVLQNRIKSPPSVGKKISQVSSVERAKSPVSSVEEIMTPTDSSSEEDVLSLADLPPVPVSNRVDDQVHNMFTSTRQED